MKKPSAKKFSVIGAVLIVLGVTLVMTAVWLYFSGHKKASAPAAPTPSSVVSATPPATATSSKQYFRMTQWGVRAPYEGKYHLVFTINTQYNYLAFTANELAAFGGDCNTRGGGHIARYKANEIPDPGPGQTAAELSKAAPDTYVRVGEYYYVFAHEQAACGLKENDAAEQKIQSEVNDAVKALVPTLETDPNT